MTAFFAKAKGLSPGRINKEPFDYILGESVDICNSVWTVQSNNEINSANNISQILDFFQSFRNGNNNAGKYNDLIDKINELID